MTASCTRRPPTIRIEIGSRVDRNIVRLFGSEGLQAVRCYKKISGGETQVLNRKRSRNPIFMQSQSDRWRNQRVWGSHCYNYLSQRESWQSKQSKHVNSTTRGITSSDGTASESKCCLY